MNISDVLVLSIFPGIGLFDMGFEKEGFCCVKGPEQLFGGDIRGWHVPRGKFNGIIAGPPCKDFSTLANTKKGDKSYGLAMLEETKRIILEGDPDWWLVENVPRVPDIEVAGYLIRRVILDAHWLGGDQRRKRKFQFGTKFLDRRVSLEVPLFESPVIEPPVTATEMRAGLRDKHRNPYKRSRSWKRICALQGLPEGFKLRTFLKSAAGEVVGQGVPVHVAQAWARAIRLAYYD